MLAAVITIDARRPACWLVAAATLAVVMLVPASRLPAAAAAGMLLAAAAVGSLRRAPPTAELVGLRLLARLVWPLGAAAVAAAAAAVRHDAAGRAVVAATLAAAAAGSVAVAAVAARMAPGGRPEEPEPPEQSAGGPAVVGRSFLDAAAMASALVGMAVCYFLAPQWSGWYALVATSWFTLLAVPTATIVGGDERLRRELAATAPERPRWAGAPVVAARTLAGYAALLAWPAAVAAVVSRDRTLGWQDPPAAIAMLAVLAVAAATLAWVADRRGWREDATLAALAALHATALAAVARVA